MIKARLKALRAWLRFGRKRSSYLIGQNFHFGSNVQIFPGFACGNRVYVGHHTEIGPDVQIGHFTSISAYVAMIGNDHKFSSPGVPIVDSGRPLPVKTLVGHDVLIGWGSVILRGVRIGNGAVIAAGSVVTKDVAAYDVVGGNPAVSIKRRFTQEEIANHDSYLATYLSENPLPSHNKTFGLNP